MMGIGGGTLTVPLLTAFNYPIRRAVGTASALGFVIGVPGAIGFVLSGWNAANLPPASLGYANLIGFALIVPATMLMAPVGARIAHTINPRHAAPGFRVLPVRHLGTDVPEPGRDRDRPGATGTAWPPR